MLGQFGPEWDEPPKRGARASRQLQGKLQAEWEILGNDFRNLRRGWLEFPYDYNGN